MSKLTISKILNHETAPEKKNEGQFWYDTTKDVLNRSNGNTYIPIPVGDNLISAGSTDTVKTALNNKQDKLNYVTESGNNLSLETEANINIKAVRQLNLESTVINASNADAIYLPSSTFIGGTNILNEVSKKQNKLSTYSDSSTHEAHILTSESIGEDSTGEESIAESGIDVKTDLVKIWNNGIRNNSTFEITGFNNVKINGLTSLTGDIIDASIPSTPVEGHIASTNAVKSYVDTSLNNKADKSDLSNVVTLTDDQTITGSKKFYDPSKSINDSVTISSDKIKVHYAEDNNYTEIEPASIELKNNASHGSTSINGGGISLTNSAGSSLVSPSVFYNSYFNNSDFLVCSNGATIVDKDIFYGTVIGTPDIAESSVRGIPTFISSDHSILFKVGIDYSGSTGSSISGEVVDNNISSSSLDTHIPTSKAVYDLVKDKADKSDLTNKQDKLNYYAEGDSGPIITYVGGSYSFAEGDPYISSQSGIYLHANSEISLNTDKFIGTGIVTSLGTNNNSKKLATEGAIISALSDKQDILNYYSETDMRAGISAFYINLSSVEEVSLSTSYGNELILRDEVGGITLNISDDDLATFNGSAIATKIDSSVGAAHNKLPTAKAVYDAIKNKANKSDLTNKQDKLYNITENFIGELSYIYLNAENISGTAIVNTVNSNSTDNKLPTAKAVYDAIQNIDVNITPVNTLDLVLTSSSDKVYTVTPKMENNTPVLTIELQEGNTSIYKPCYILGEDGSSIYLLEVKGDKGSETFLVSNVSNSVSNINANGIGLLIKGSDGINYNLVPAGEAGYEYYTLSCVKDSTPVVSINLDNGDAIINENTVYSLIINSDTNFVLPEQKAGSFAQILVCAKITSDVNIDFGTTHFFNDEIPTIETNNNYDILFEHDPIENVWVCGTIKKG
jgi:hypothetical protein